MLPAIRDWLLFPKSPAKLGMILVLPLLVALGLLIGTLIRWEKTSLEEIQVSGLKEVGRAFYQHIMSTRIWTSSHGGVYFESDDLVGHTGPTQTEPGLDGLAIMGKKYRKVNPNVVTSRIMDILNQRSGYKFHITSLNPSTPANRPDAWEEASLKDFQKGVRETTTVEVIDGARVFRYMAPLTLEESCLKCHQWGGYKLADLRGGISINFPMDYSDSLYARQMKRTALSFATIGVIAILFLMVLVWYFSNRISAGFNIKLEQEEKLRRLNHQLTEILARDKKIIENIGDGMAVIDDEGSVEMANRVFLRAIGLSAEEVIGQPIHSFAEDSLATAVLAPYRQEGMGGEPSKDLLAFRKEGLGESSEVTLDGKSYTVSSIFVIDEERGGYFCELRILHDATKEKLKAAMEVSGAAAHEIRQPLAILMSLKDLIRAKAEQGADFAEELTALDEQVGRVNDIISRMLTVTAYRTKRYAEDMKIFDLMNGEESAPTS